MNPMLRDYILKNRRVEQPLPTTEDMGAPLPVDMENPETTTAPPPVVSPSVDPMVISWLTGGAAKTIDDGQAVVDAARESDRKSGLSAGLELAGRQLVGGITRTPVGQSLGQRPAELPGALAEQMARRRAVADSIEKRRRTALDESTLGLHAAQVAKLNYESSGEKDAATAAAKKAAEAESLRRFELSHADQQANAAASRDIASAGFGIRKAEFEQSTADKTAKKELEAKKEAAAVEASKIPYGQGMFVPRHGVRIDDTVARQSSATAGLYGAAGAGISTLNGALKAFAAKPSPATKDEVTAAVRGVSAALSAAYGQGAMSESEASAMRTALGADIFSAAGVEALIGSIFGDSPEKTAPIITRRANVVMKQLDDMAKARMKSANYEFVEAPAAKVATKYLVSPDKKRRVPVYADGTKGPEEPNG